MRPQYILCLVTLGLFAAGVCAAGAESEVKAPNAESTVPETPQKELFKGKVVLLQEALKRRGIAAYDEFKEQAVLETPAGELIPIIPDWRGRAFYQDEKLRDRKVELVGYRRPGVPYLQVLMVFTFDKENVRHYTDYWCDICAIPMYEIKACECCQGPIRLRFQPQELPAYLRPREPASTGNTD